MNIDFVYITLSTWTQTKNKLISSIIERFKLKLEI